MEPAGVDNIDLETARNRGIIVTNTPGILTEDTADMTMALILWCPGGSSRARPICRRAASGRVVADLDARPPHLGQELCIIGMGRIGRAVARRAKAFGLSINYHNRRRVPAAVEEELGATYWDSLDQMLAHMDIMSVNCPHTPRPSTFCRRGG